MFHIFYCHSSVQIVTYCAPAYCISRVGNGSNSAKFLANNATGMFDWETVVSNCRLMNPYMIRDPSDMIRDSHTVTGHTASSLSKEEAFDEELMKHVEVFIFDV